jgi:hypothetical protein
MGDVLYMIFIIILWSRNTFQIKQILMGYYADLEVERSIAEGDYENRTYSKKRSH